MVAYILCIPRFTTELNHPIKVQAEFANQRVTVAYLEYTKLLVFLSCFSKNEVRATSDKSFTS